MAVDFIVKIYGPYYSIIIEKINKYIKLKCPLKKSKSIFELRFSAFAPTAGRLTFIALFKQTKILLNFIIMFFYSANANPQVALRFLPPSKNNQTQFKSIFSVCFQYLIWLDLNRKSYLFRTDQH